MSAPWLMGANSPMFNMMSADNVARKAIAAGGLDTARRMLGRWPAAFGEVVHGDGRGRTLGFPTANVVPQSLVLPPAGVYAVEVIRDGEAFGGVARFLGLNPPMERLERAIANASFGALKAQEEIEGIIDAL